MGIKIEMNLIDPDMFTDAVQQTLFECLDNTLSEIANEAKSNNTYVDRTGNLRSSIGYVIYKNGEFLKANFEGGKGPNGSRTGLNIANDVAKDFSSGYVCVFVAGMDYALYVESKGFDVISGSWMQFDNVFEKNAKVIQEMTGIEFVKKK